MTRLVVGGQRRIALGVEVAQAAQSGNAPTALRWVGGAWEHDKSKPPVDATARAEKPWMNIVRIAIMVAILAICAGFAIQWIVLRWLPEFTNATRLLENQIPATTPATQNASSPAHSAATTTTGATPLPAASATTTGEHTIAPASVLATALPATSPAATTTQPPTRPPSSGQRPQAQPTQPPKAAEDRQKGSVAVLFDAQDTGASSKNNPAETKATTAQTGGPKLAAITPDGAGAVLRSPQGETRIYRKGDKLPSGEEITAIDRQAGKIVAGGKEIRLND